MVVELIVIAVLAFVAALATAGFLLKRRYADIFQEGVEEVSEANNYNEVSEAMEEEEKAEDVADVVSDAEVIEEEKPVPKEVRNSVKKKSSRSKKKRRSISKSLEKKIIRMYKAGKSPKEIAKALGISTSSVYRRVKNALKT